MAQHDYVIANGTGAAVRSDLNNALAAIVSQNSGATEPATTYAYQFWADTTTATLKLRNSANSAWIELMQLDGTLTMEDGTTALPGLAFRNDLDTGLWRPGANQLAISTNAVERVEFGATEVVFNDGGVDYDFRVEGDTNANLLFVDASTDRVGIGSSSPVFLTDILSGTANTGANVNNPSQLSVTGPNKSLTGGGATVFINSNTDLAVDTGGSIALSGRNTTSSTNSVVWGVVKGAKENATSTNTAGYLAFASANHAVGGLVEAMRIDSSQRVGIGTTSPGSYNSSFDDLVVANSGDGGVTIATGTNNNGTLAFADGTTGDQAYRGFVQYSHTNDALVFGTGGNDRGRFDSSGRLLVGTSSAFSVGSSSQYGKFQMVANTASSTGSAVLGLAKGAAGSATSSGNELALITFGGSDGSEFAQIGAYVDATPGASDYPGRLVFSTTADGASSPTERMRIDNAGNVGINVTNPSAGASATSGVAFRPGNHDVWFNHANGVGSGTVYTYFTYNSGAIGSISQNGTTAVAYNTTSDYRLKENVTAVTDGMVRLQQLKPCRFNFISEPDRTVDGFIAHEVQRVIPEAITGEKDAEDADGNPIYQGIDQSKLVPLLTAALQEAIGEIESLKARLTAAGL